VWKDLWSRAIDRIRYPDAMSLTCLLLNGSVSGVRIRSGTAGELSMPRGNREQAVLKLRKAGLERWPRKAKPNAAMTEQGRVGDPFPGQFESLWDGPSATCR
jgi:hypothetical protein